LPYLDVYLTNSDVYKLTWASSKTHIFGRFIFWR
jgi:hypothetical protein